MRLFKKSKELVLLSPAHGTVIGLQEVPDPVFARGTLGPGFAVVPNDRTVVSPVAGVVSAVFPSHHAVVIEATDGVQVLVHAGLDTVQLEGRHLQTAVSVGENVEPNDPLIHWDPAAVAAEGYATHVVVCLIESGPFSDLQVRSGIAVPGTVAATATRVSR